MDLTTRKKQLRKTLKARRMALTPEVLAAISQGVFENWKSHFSLEDVHYLHLFLSMDKFNEIDTGPIRQYVEKSRHRTRILVPVMDVRNETLLHYELDEEITMEKNRFGVPEPKMRKIPVSPDRIDMVIVPLLGFDARGHRLGYGKGYYDRFLSRLRPDCPKIGIAAALSYVPEGLPTEPHDVSLDFVVTEEKVYNFSETKLPPNT